jgi:CheY-like chemotaxis protein
MQRYSILWADDEIDLLKPHILFLRNKGYDVTPVNSGSDALDKCNEQNFDVVFLDENMPGMTGLETLSQIKATKPSLPVVMITKSEEEHIMEEAIGAKIADYLIKPLNPNQILLSVRKILDGKRLVTEKTTQGYQQDFRNIAMAYNDRIGHEEWADIYKKLVFWELALDGANDKSMAEVLDMQKSEANSNFAKFVMENYEDWLNDPKAEKPLLSHQLMKKKVFPLISSPRSRCSSSSSTTCATTSGKSSKAFSRSTSTWTRSRCTTRSCPPPRPLPATPSSRACCPAKWKSTTPTCG